MSTKKQQEPQQEVATHEEDAPVNVDEHKAFAIIGYLVPILFFIPMLSDKGKKNTFAMFHANQQLNFLLLIITLFIVTNFVLIWSLMVLQGIIFFTIIISFMFLGMLNAAKGTMKELPLIGKYKLLS